MNSVIRPETNVATSENKARVLAEGYHNYLFESDNPGEFTWHRIGTNSHGIIVQLAQPYLLSSVQFFLYNFNNTRYKYFIESSVNKVDWAISPLCGKSCCFHQNNWNS